MCESAFAGDDTHVLYSCVADTPYPDGTWSVVDGSAPAPTGAYTDACNQIVVGCDECPGSAATICVTMSWIDADVTKEFNGETFPNGGTLEMCPDTHNTGGTGELWKKTDFHTTGTSWGWPVGTADALILAMNSFGGGMFQTQAVVIKGQPVFGTYFMPSLYAADWGVLKFYGPYGTGTGTSSKALSSSSFGSAGFSPSTAIGAGHFGSLTTTGGITLTWSRGLGNWK